MKNPILLSFILAGASLVLADSVFAGGRGGGSSFGAGRGFGTSASYGRAYSAPSTFTSFKTPSLATSPRLSAGGYSVGGPHYKIGEYYKTTGLPKVERSDSARQQFLKSQGYIHVPSGYQVDHMVPLSKGGADTPANMQLLTVEQHQAKTAAERARNK